MCTTQVSQVPATNHIIAPIISHIGKKRDLKFKMSEQEEIQLVEKDKEIKNLRRLLQDHMSLEENRIERASSKKGHARAEFSIKPTFCGGKILGEDGEETLIMDSGSDEDLMPSAPLMYYNSLERSVNHLKESLSSLHENPFLLGMEFFQPIFYAAHSVSLYQLVFCVWLSLANGIEQKV